MRMDGAAAVHSTGREGGILPIYLLEKRQEQKYEQGEDQEQEQGQEQDQG